MEIIEKYTDNQLKAYIYDNRLKIGENLLKLIKDNRYTKSSFSKLTGISRPTIDKLIKGEIDNNTTLKNHVDKILTTFNISLEELINFECKQLNNKEIIVASNNAPENHEISDSAKRIFSIIDDIVDLCEIYCDR
ncbi:helix-turn-helix domain-containing protein [Clostridium sp. ZS2-4]|uniref:helix-turn-helix domain-containing protein n=1 Tax=Clostridium sp. ZS2-4 TaxID=2987703 RepID=UPI00227CE9C6|nr:helix-turn-helix transcriptional regulator [Clostridium sp. ZS2-4]MCY6354492.1 helix-turn-helix transcriptional regulator [Clostridium sp. ZS2-4]